LEKAQFKFLFSHGKGFMSKFVAYFVKSKYLSHTVGNFKIFKADVIMESSEGGVDFAPAKYFKDNNTIYAIVKPISGSLTTKEGMDEHLSWLIDTYGNAGYDWLAAGAIGMMNRFKWLWKIMGTWILKKINKKTVHCTEIWARLLTHAGYKVVANMNPELVSPLTLLRALVAAKADFEVEMIDPKVQKEVDRKDD
jgi:hypothetical protein